MPAHNRVQIQTHSHARAHCGRCRPEAIASWVPACLLEICPGKSITMTGKRTKQAVCKALLNFCEKSVFASVQICEFGTRTASAVRFQYHKTARAHTRKAFQLDPFIRTSALQCFLSSLNACTVNRTSLAHRDEKDDGCHAQYKRKTATFAPPAV